MADPGKLKEFLVTSLHVLRRNLCPSESLHAKKLSNKFSNEV